jgi:hypothetical protein
VPTVQADVGRPAPIEPFVCRPPRALEPQRAIRSAEHAEWNPASPALGSHLSAIATDARAAHPSRGSCLNLELTPYPPPTFGSARSTRMLHNHLKYAVDTDYSRVESTRWNWSSALPLLRARRLLLLDRSPTGVRPAHDRGGVRSPHQHAFVGIAWSHASRVRSSTDPAVRDGYGVIRSSMTAARSPR